MFCGNAPLFLSHILWAKYNDENRINSKIRILTHACKHLTKGRDKKRYFQTSQSVRKYIEPDLYFSKGKSTNWCLWTSLYKESKSCQFVTRKRVFAVYSDIKNNWAVLIDLKEQI